MLKKACWVPAFICLVTLGHLGLRRHSLSRPGREVFLQEQDPFLEKVQALPSVLRVDRWPHGIRFAQWNHTGEKEAKEFQGHWVTMLQQLLPHNCNIVDIGAHGGDTTLPLAVVARGGTVVAFEMGVPFEMLEINKKLNLHLKIEAFKIAVSDTSGKVFYDGSDCDGCNGGIVEIETRQKVESVRLVPFLLEHFSREFVENICMVKIDAEGYDSFIMSDFPAWFRPRVVWPEWFALLEQGPRFANTGCTLESEGFFHSILKLGYTVYQLRLPLTPTLGCSIYQPDLLLMTAADAAEVHAEPMEIASMSPLGLTRRKVSEVTVNVTKLVPVYADKPLH